MAEAPALPPTMRAEPVSAPRRRTRPEHPRRPRRARGRHRARLSDDGRDGVGAHGQLGGADAGDGRARLRRVLLLGIGGGMLAARPSGHDVAPAHSGSFGAVPGRGPSSPAVQQSAAPALDPPAPVASAPPSPQPHPRRLRARRPPRPRPRRHRASAASTASPSHCARAAAPRPHPPKGPAPAPTPTNPFEERWKLPLHPMTVSSFLSAVAALGVCGAFSHRGAVRRGRVVPAADAAAAQGLCSTESKKPSRADSTPPRGRSSRRASGWIRLPRPKVPPRGLLPTPRADGERVGALSPGRVGVQGGRSSGARAVRAQAGRRPRAEALAPRRLGPRGDRRRRARGEARRKARRRGAVGDAAPDRPGQAHRHRDGAKALRVEPGARRPRRREDADPRGPRARASPSGSAPSARPRGERSVRARPAAGRGASAAGRARVAERIQPESDRVRGRGRGSSPRRSAASSERRRSPRTTSPRRAVATKTTCVPRGATTCGATRRATR